MIDLIHRVWPDWEAVQEIGYGSSSAVYLVRKTTGQLLSYSAVKVIRIPDDEHLWEWRSEGINDEKILEFAETELSGKLEEVRIMQSLRGLSNIASIEDYAVTEESDSPARALLIRTELLTPLKQWIGLQKDRRVAEEDIVRIGTDICGALEICEKKRFLHRDIKPENIYINDMGFFKLGDFGVARKLNVAPATLSQKGTLQFVAPEVYSLSRYDCRADIYSLGLVLYKLANGNAHPFCAPVRLESPIELEKAIVRRLSGEKLPPPLNASPALAAVILKACAFDPSERYDSAALFREALQGFLLPAQAKKDVRTDAAQDEAVSLIFPAGEGTEKSPYEISSPEEFELLSRLTAEGACDTDGMPYAGKQYVLTCDITFPEGRNTSRFSPIGPSDERPFSGRFDGGGHRITGLTVCVSSERFAGVFGYIRGGCVSDLSVVSTSVSCTKESVFGCGGIAGVLNHGTLRNCHFDGAVEARILTGGIVGQAINESSVSGCTASGKIHAFMQAGGICGCGKLSTFASCAGSASVSAEDGYAGGILGDSDIVTARNCTNTGSVSATYHAGGIAGFTKNSFITQSENKGLVTVTVNMAGGIAGRCEKTTVSDSSNFAGVYSCGGHAGGIAGYAVEKSVFTVCQNIGTVNCEDCYAGGIAGRIRNDVTVNDCSNEGSVSCNEEFAGGIAGYTDSCSLLRCVNTGAIRAYASTKGGVGCCFGGIAGGADGSSFSECENKAALSCENTTEIEAGGERIGGICGVASESSFTSCKNDGSIHTVCKHVGGIVGFGLFGCVLSGCVNTASVSGWDNTGGLIGNLMSYREHENIFLACSVSGCSNSGPVTTIDSNCGGVAGLCDTRVSIVSCLNTGSIYCSSAAGGIIGKTDGPCDIAGCFSTASIRVKSSFCGGIVGDQCGGTLKDCYSTGVIAGTKYLGGIAGRLFRGGVMKGCVTEALITGGGADTWCALTSKHEETVFHGSNYSLKSDNDAPEDSVTGIQISAEETEHLLPAAFLAASGQYWEKTDNHE